MLEADDTNDLASYIGVALAVYTDMKSNTGLILTMGKGEIISSYTMQKVNMRSSIE